MKTSTRKALIFGTALAILLFAAPGAQSRGVHKIKTNNSQMQNYFGAEPQKKLVAHKKKKSSKGKRSKERSTKSAFSMVTKDS